MNVKDIINGDIQAAARLMRDVEQNKASARENVAELVPRTGNAHIIGVTGAPGTGKSTLLDQLIFEFRGKKQTVGVVVIDPSSPYSGGAILGDRLRMQRHATDQGVFIRSLASRGQLGGLSPTTYDIVTIMDAMGKNVILIETVGAGQDEIDITHLAHTNIVVTTPGAGDGIQMIKAGILESGDIFVVSKSDQPDSDTTVGQLEAMLAMRDFPDGLWKPPVVKTSPLFGDGIELVMAEIERHKKHLDTSIGQNQKEIQLEQRFLKLLQNRLFEEAKILMKRMDHWETLLNNVRQGKIDLNSAVENVIEHLKK